MVFDILGFLIFFVMIWFASGIMAWFIELYVFVPWRDIVKYRDNVFHPIMLFNKGIQGIVYLMEVLAVLVIVTSFDENERKKLKAGI